MEEATEKPLKNNYLLQYNDSLQINNYQLQLSHQLQLCIIAQLTSGYKTQGNKISFKVVW